MAMSRSLWLESEMENRGGGRTTDDLSARLQALERRAHRIRVPPTYIPLLYTLKDHLGHARGRLERSRPGPGVSSPG